MKKNLFSRKFKKSGGNLYGKIRAPKLPAMPKVKGK